ncbi:CUE domain-containing protein 2 isoform X4 [Rousettus aegyptiacus]|uniref:CUE domain-containing protein 2 isoform X4 n=1 Tax=Rousettus aegyptiacus TaxID=9407 RepID=UPI00168D543D|nr:CUE domain-containing protein 2 isoform X4 [Rousettus aegyptiacus]
MELERIVSAALLAFVQTHLPEADLSGLDEVIFSYVLGVLEDLGPSGPSEENFDMEAFTEMMEAYVPGFAHIPRGTIGDMMQKLSGQLSGARNKEPLQRPEKLKEDTRASAAGDTQDEDQPRCLGGPQKDELKSFILQKYMMVDSAEDQKIHRPMAPREAPKKLIRYIDNQVVSTKGERFKDVRNPEAEEMKATYINLKPARKYRFH